jgi:hypothetical protein
MSKLEQLKEMVQKDGTEKMKELVVIVENYIPGLNNIFKDREVDKDILKEFDFPMFLRELQEGGIFKNRSGMQVKLLVMDVFYITRHVWEFEDKNGKMKTGDDLHKAWPSMYGSDEAMSVEDLFKDMHYI